MKAPGSLLGWVLLSVMLSWAQAPAFAAPSGLPGEALFQGRIALTARIWGHDKDLPSQASRCSNCHALGVAPAASGPATPVGPVLSATTLTRTAARRGGPPSRFEEASFCRLLREGIDPAQIVVPRVMPRYTLSDAQCRDLWQYLLSVP